MLQHLAVRYLRKRGWIVFWLDEQAHFCDGGLSSCWLSLYLSEQKRRKPHDAKHDTKLV